MTQPEPAKLAEKFTAYCKKNMARYLDTLEDMVAINSHTDNAEGVNKLAQHIASLFGRLGFSSQFFPSDNKSYGKHLVCVKDSGAHNSGKVALISHLDTVYPPEEEQRNNFSFRVDGDRIYGPGTCDAKGGIAVIYMLLECLKEEHPGFFNSLAWYLLFNASEETDSSDFGKLCARVIPPDTKAALVFEASSSAGENVNIVTSRKGRAVFRVESQGRSAHAGAAHHMGFNAIVRLCRVVAHLAELTDYSKGITVNTGVIGGGGSMNRVPDYAFADVEMRALESSVFDETIEKIKSLSSQKEGLSLNAKLVRAVRPWPQNEASGKLYNIWAQAAADMGLKAFHESRGGLSDGNLLWETLPVIDGLGPAGSNAHSSGPSIEEQEFVVISDFIPKAVLSMTGLIRLFGTKNSA
ncbi:MAG: M20/M25/M40 family metallo-hydrolase [Leptospirales bacterium]|nr:M20/M25/M40 family metallo-hydrolase [Leptospirales bacterium]